MLIDRLGQRHLVLGFPGFASASFERRIVEGRPLKGLLYDEGWRQFELPAASEPPPAPDSQPWQGRDIEVVAVSGLTNVRCSPPLQFEERGFFRLLPVNGRRFTIRIEHASVVVELIDQEGLDPS